MEIRFEGLEHTSDGGFQPAEYRFDGDVERGWLVTRNTGDPLHLGPGYRLLATECCGVCSTDLDRRFLPFPLPQIIGHELLARDPDGRRYAVEINASHRARGLATDCPYCQGGLPTHCPERLVLGIHDLPGGFGPNVLVPVEAAIPVPDGVPDGTLVLLEPFAAALHAVDTVAPGEGDRIAVLGPRRLGMLVIAAAAARRRAGGPGFTITAITRRAELHPIARALGADQALTLQEATAGSGAPPFDLVIDTTGNPDGLVTALGLARREVHLKSTHGRQSAGLRHTTELVVDEVRLARWTPEAAGLDLALPGASPPEIAWLSRRDPPRGTPERVVRRFDDPQHALAFFGGRSGRIPGADAAVVDSAAGIDAVLRPRPDRHTGLVRPRGTIFLAAPTADPTPLCRAVADRDLRLSSSRCGDFATALGLIEGDGQLRHLGEVLVTHRFPAHQLDRAFAVAAARECLKAVVDHPR